MAVGEVLDADIVGLFLGKASAGSVIGAVSNAINAIVVAPFTTAYLVVLYYELRAPTGGYDLQQRAAQVVGSE